MALKSSKEQGHCANCDSENIDYGSIIPEDTFIGYPYECEDCKDRGIEWYSLTYSETISSTMSELL
jgi:hypothetical protein